MRRSFQAVIMRRSFQAVMMRRSLGLPKKMSESAGENGRRPTYGAFPSSGSIPDLASGEHRQSADLLRHLLYIVFQRGLDDLYLATNVKRPASFFIRRRSSSPRSLKNATVASGSDTRIMLCRNFIGLTYSSLPTS